MKKKNKPKKSKCLKKPIILTGYIGIKTKPRKDL
ncbi:hypothetical protein cje25_08739 [Campylobacter jejuni subsp. jejuni 1997-14]|nr:hypothetical protein cje25_08739 [Campylobacter jejuni subsp. jejuni 1997-14]